MGRLCRIAAPTPAGGRVRAHVAEPARTALLRGHSGKKFTREPGHYARGHVQRVKPRRCECCLQRRRRRRLLRVCGGYRRAAEPNPRSRSVFDLKKHVTGFGQVLVAEANDPLNVGKIDAVHKSASHSFVSSSDSDASRPWRMRVFLSKSDTVSPGC